MNISDDLFREMLLYMRVQLKSDALFFQAIKLLHTVLSNIVQDPTNLKYQKLRLSNEKIKKNIADVEQSIFMLEMIGFQKQQLVEDGKEEMYLIMSPGSSDIRDLIMIEGILADVLKQNNISPLTKNMRNPEEAKKQETSKIFVPMN